jgi:peptidoglycan/xylan/chitin deacetylase (PgdA/CDA1 family)
MYVPTGLLGEPHPHIDGERIMDAVAVRDLVSAGVEVGGHTVDHPRLTELCYDAALEQMRRSRVDLEQLLGLPVRSMAYPFGAYDAQTIRAAGAAGFETACACDGAGPWEPLRLPREPVFPSITTFRLRLKMAGLYGPASRVAEIRNRLFSRR